MFNDKLPLTPDTTASAKLHDVADRIDAAGQKAADSASTLIEKTRDGAASALDTLADKVETARTESGSALHRGRQDRVDAHARRGRMPRHRRQGARAGLREARPGRSATSAASRASRC